MHLSSTFNSPIATLDAAGRRKIDGPTHQEHWQPALITCVFRSSKPRSEGFQVSANQVYPPVYSGASSSFMLTSPPAKTWVLGSYPSGALPPGV